MKKIGVCFLVACFFVCCNNDVNVRQAEDSNAVSDGTIADTNAATNITVVNDTTACYAYMQHMDTIQLSINISGHTFTGNLRYYLKEKDRNNGTVAGKITGDTLIADYTFNAEGMQSVREVAFIKSGNSLKEGFGEVEEVNGKMAFTNPAQLRFSGFVLTPASCK